MTAATAAPGSPSPPPPNAGPPAGPPEPPTPPPATAVTMTSGVASLLPFARPVRGRLALAGLLALASTGAGLVPLWVIAHAVGRLVAEPGPGTLADLTGLAAIALGAVAARYLLLGLSVAVAHVAAYDLLYRLRVRLAERLARLPLGWLTRRRTGEVKKVMADDVERLEVFLAHGIPDLVAAAGAVAAVAVWMVIADWRLALATLAPAPLALAAVAVALRRSSPHMGAYHDALGRLNATVADLARGLPVVRTFCPPGEPVGPVTEAVEDYVRIVQRYSADFLPFGTLYYVLLGSTAATVVPAGLVLWRADAVDATTLILFLVIGIGVLHPVRELLKLFSQLAHLSTGGNLVREILATPPPPSGDRPVTLTDHTVELDDVTFRYAPGAPPALDGVSLTLPAGTVTALVGTSGSGKTTLARLLPRFFDPDAGEVRLGGVPLSALPEDQLQSSVAFVFQETFLFDDTVAANLRAGRTDAADAEVEAAARQARAHDFIHALPRAYATRLGERGARLSGGERQRLAIARAILKDGPVVVLDEATAFADPDNETAIQEAITSLVAPGRDRTSGDGTPSIGTGGIGTGGDGTSPGSGRTVLVIAHRLSTIAGADQIAVLDRGRLVERGRHDELLAAGGRYARLWADFTAAGSLALGRDGGAGDRPVSEG